ncbi:MAG: hypothetical protein LBS32_04330 [Clostridiales Family XIII bacterium]|jgi:hypothetical protein|nr:hypothetical protein [Clostridiales Family XIII bacterium]
MGRWEKHVITTNISSKSLTDAQREGEKGRILRMMWMDGRVLPGAMYLEACWIAGPTPPDGGPPEHMHSEDDEFLAFIGGDPEHPDDLNAEVEFFIEDERLLLTESCFVFVPKGVRHCPLRFLRVDRPVFHFSGYPGGEYSRERKA